MLFWFCGIFLMMVYFFFSGLCGFIILRVVVFFNGCISMLVCKGGLFGWVILWRGFFGCEGMIGIGVCILGICFMSFLGVFLWICGGFWLLGFFLLFCFSLGCIWVGGVYLRLFLFLVFYFFLSGCGLYVVVVFKLVLLLLENELLCF